MIRGWREQDVRVFAVAASLLLSLYSALRNPVPNTDAYTYLRTAEIFLQDGLAAAIAYYPWAAHSVLIAAVHDLLNVDMLVGAQLLNALYFALLVWAFISLVREIDSSRPMSLLAAACILLYPQLNEYRPEVIRDIAFLALSLTALLQLVRLGHRQRLRHAFGFSLLTAAAALFRPEALIYLLLAPFSLLLWQALSLAQRLKLLAALQGSSLLLCAALLGALSLLDVDAFSLLLRGASLYQPFMDQAQQILSGDAQELSSALFLDHAAEFSGQYVIAFLITGLLTIVLIKLFTGFGWVYLAVLAYGMKKRLLAIPPRLAVPMLAYLLIAALILFTFVFVTRFMTTRYTLMFSTIAVLLVPIVVMRSAQLARLHDRSRAFNRVVGVLALYLFIDSFVSFGVQKDFQVDAVRYIEQHVPPSAALLTNSPYVAYRSGRIADYDRLTEQVDAGWITEAAPGTWMALSLRGGNDAVVLPLTEEGLLRLDRYFPAQGRPRMGLYQRLP